MTTSLVFTRPRPRWLGRPIEAWEGDDSAHVGIYLGVEVIDATLLHGVKQWPRDQWLSERTVVQEIAIQPRSPEHAADAVRWLLGRLGRGYDWRGILGFPLLRDLDDPERDWCSELAAGWFARHTGTELPGRTGRRGVRALRWMAQGYASGRQGDAQ